MTAKRPAAVVLALALVAAGTAVLLVGCDEVTPDTEPGFGAQTVADQAYTVGEAIASLVLPGASGGNPPLTYSLTPAVPGLSFSPSTRTLSGAPTAAGDYAMTYRVEDSDGDAATLRFDVLVNPTPVVDAEPSFGPRTVADQTYTVGVSIASLVLPEASGGNPPLTYSLTPAVPGLSFSPSTRTLSGTPTAAAEGTHAMTYRVEDADGDVARLTFAVRVDPALADTEPSFGQRTVADQTYTIGVSIASLVLPEASGGNPPLTYSLTPEVPGLSFSPSTRTLSGTPTAAAEGTHAMTYRVEDADGDAATLRFDVRVNPAPAADTEPTFGQQTVADQTYTVGEAITPLMLPAATGGDGNLVYSLSPGVAGLTFDAGTRTLRGTPSSARTYRMTYRVVDSDGDAATLRFTIEVDPPDTQPSFDGQTVPDQTYTVGTPITPLVLPAATGGDGRLTYSLTPTVPGLDFNMRTRTLDGRPTAVAAYPMDYRVEDTDGDAATLSFLITVDAGSGPKIYWTERAPGEIWRANIDGSGIEKLVDHENVPGLKDPEDIDLDLDAGKMYWIGDGNKFGWDGYIWRANLDGSDVEVVYRLGRSGPIFPVALAVDVRNRKLYWTAESLRYNEGLEDRIVRANLDGSSTEVLVYAEDAICRAPRICFRGPYGIALDVIGGKMYWLDNLSEKIWRADLDGRNAETLANFGVTVYLNDIEVDAVGGKMYFTSSGNRIYRSNLDGSGVETILRFGIFDIGYIRGIALDVPSGKIYFADGQKIQRANLDGSQLEDVVTETGSFFNPSWVALDLRDRE